MHPHHPPLRLFPYTTLFRSTDLQVTLESLAAIDAVHHVIVLNRDGVSLPATAGRFSVRNIDLSIEDSEALDQEIEKLVDEADRKSTRLNSSHRCISYAVFCL